jgi:transposase
MVTKSTVPGKRRRHTAEFRAQVVSSCREAGVSVAAVALANGLNANLLRKWIKAANGALEPGKLVTIGEEEPRLTTVPVRVATPVANRDAEVRLDLRRGTLAIQLAWPAGEVEQLAALIKDLLR